MALSFHVIFSYHYALLFRVPTWGLVLYKIDKFIIYLFYIKQIYLFYIKQIYLFYKTNLFILYKTNLFIFYKIIKKNYQSQYK